MLATRYTGDEPSRAERSPARRPRRWTPTVATDSLRPRLCDFRAAREAPDCGAATRSRRQQ